MSDKKTTSKRKKPTLRDQLKVAQELADYRLRLLRMALASLEEWSDDDGQTSFVVRRALVGGTIASIKAEIGE